jgi:2'-5' RNA ligase
MDALQRIERTVVATVERCGLAHDERAVFAPHLTLARPRGRAQLDGGPGALGRVWPWRPEEVILFESVAGAADRYPRRVCARLDDA